MTTEVKYLYTENYQIHTEDIINREIPCVQRLEKTILLKWSHYSYLWIQCHSSLMTHVVTLWLILSHTSLVTGKVNHRGKNNVCINRTGTLKRNPVFSTSVFLALWSEIITEAKGGKRVTVITEDIPRAKPWLPRLWSACGNTDSETMGSPHHLEELGSTRHLFLEFFCLLLQIALLETDSASAHWPRASFRPELLGCLLRSAC